MGVLVVAGNLGRWVQREVELVGRRSLQEAPVPSLLRISVFDHLGRRDCRPNSTVFHVDADPVTSD